MGRRLVQVGRIPPFLYAVLGWLLALVGAIVTLYVQASKVGGPWTYSRAVYVALGVLLFIIGGLLYRMGRLRLRKKSSGLNEQ